MLLTSGTFWTIAPAELFKEVVYVLHHPFWFWGSWGVNPSGLLSLFREGKNQGISGQLSRLGHK